MIDQIWAFISQNIWPIWIIVLVYAIYSSFDKRDIKNFKKFGPGFFLFAIFSFILLSVEFNFTTSDMIQSVSSASIGVVIGFLIRGMKN